MTGIGSATAHCFTLVGDKLQDEEDRGIFLIAPSGDTGWGV
jgi:hypothetical protein